MSTFAALKKSSGSNLDDLKKKIEETQNQEGGNDERYWTPTVDKAGNGMATIRFLPTPPADGDGPPWVRYFRHAFQENGMWFIDNCLTSIEENCPVCENNKVLWGTEIKANQDIVRKRKRKLFYVANIYVVSDPANPENDGKVKLFKFGKKIFDKIKEAMDPEFPDEKPLNPFDLWKGANFKLKIRNVDDYRSYEKSAFETPTALFATDEQLEEIWMQEYSLQEIVAKDKFKSYKQLKDRLDKVLGLKKAPSPEAGDDSPIPQEQPQRTPIKTGGEDGEDPDFAYFQSLAKQGDDVPF